MSCLLRRLYSPRALFWCFPDPIPKPVDPIFDSTSAGGYLPGGGLSPGWGIFGGLAGGDHRPMINSFAASFRGVICGALALMAVAVLAGSAEGRPAAFRGEVSFRADSSRSGTVVISGSLKDWRGGRLLVERRSSGKWRKIASKKIGRAQGRRFEVPVTAMVAGMKLRLKAKRGAKTQILGSFRADPAPEGPPSTDPDPPATTPGQPSTAPTIPRTPTAAPICQRYGNIVAELGYSFCNHWRKELVLPPTSRIRSTTVVFDAWHDGDTFASIGNTINVRARLTINTASATKVKVTVLACSASNYNVCGERQTYKWFDLPPGVHRIEYSDSFSGPWSGYAVPTTASFAVIDDLATAFGSDSVRLAGCSDFAAYCVMR